MGFLFAGFCGSNSKLPDLRGFFHQASSCNSLSLLLLLLLHLSCSPCTPSPPPPLLSLIRLEAAKTQLSLDLSSVRTLGLSFPRRLILCVDCLSPLLQLTFYALSPLSHSPVRLHSTSCLLLDCKIIPTLSFFSSLQFQVLVSGQMKICSASICNCSC